MTPTTPCRARKLLKTGVAKKVFDEFNTFGIQMLVPTGSATPIGVATQVKKNIRRNTMSNRIYCEEGLRFSYALNNMMAELFWGSGTKKQHIRIYKETADSNKMIAYFEPPDEDNDHYHLAFCSDAPFDYNVDPADFMKVALAAQRWLNDNGHLIPDRKTEVAE